MMPTACWCRNSFFELWKAIYIGKKNCATFLQLVETGGARWAYLVNKKMYGKLIVGWGYEFVSGLKLGLDKILKFKYFEAANVWLRFWSWCLVDILKRKFDSLRKNLWYELNPRVRCAFGNGYLFMYSGFLGGRGRQACIHFREASLKRNVRIHSIGVRHTQIGRLVCWPGSAKFLEPVLIAWLSLNFIL